MNALARLIAARATAPPLAVALLAEWGGGKSAFLRLLGDAVEDIAESGDPQMAGRISVVRFNAWHRSDRSVLVGIFDRVVSAFKEHGDDAHGSRRDGARRRARRRAAAVGWIERLDEREERLERDAGRSASGPLAALWRRLRLIAQVPWALVQGSWRSATVLAVTLVVAVVLVAGPFVLPLIDSDLTGWIVGAESWVNGALASSGVAALATALVAVYRIRIRGATGGEDGAGTLAGLIAATIDQEREEARARITEIDAEDATRGIADLVQDGDRRARLDAARGFVGHLGSELGEFAEQVAQAEEYWRHRALQDDGRGGDRVILLVDDLDRCVPERVVEVLHALAMLQYTSLFVTVVAADPRWLRHAVQTAGDATGVEGSHLEGYIDDAVGYLDAAFHVPYTIPREVRSDGGRYLLATAAEQDLLPSRAELAHAGLSRVPVIDPGPEAVLGGPGQAPAAPGPFTPHEVQALAAVSAVLPHPRAVQKFLVLYRLVRSGTHLPGHVRFTEPEGDHRQAALLLALLVGVPDAAARILRGLEEGADGEAFAEFVAVLADGHAEPGHETCGECAAWRRARTVVERAIDAGAPTEVAPYRRWAGEISRFSFRTEHLA